MPRRGNSFERSSAVGISVHGSRRGVHDGLHAQLLGPSHGDPQRVRRGRLNRIDQFSRQPWRIRWSLFYRLPADGHKLIHARTDLSFSLYGSIRNAGLAAPRPSNARLSTTVAAEAAEVSLTAASRLACV